MTPDLIFSICSAVAMVGWLILIIASPFWHTADKFLIGIIIALFAIVYTWLIFSAFTISDIKNFGTLDGVMKLFTDKTLVTAGWVHYLAFDLMTGIWIKKNSMKYNISHGFIIPCLFFTFMLGPIGLLLYLILRSLFARNYFANNY